MKFYLILFSLLCTVFLTAQDKPAPPSLPADAVPSVITGFQKADNAARKTAVLKVKTDQGDDLVLKVLATTALHDAAGKTVGSDRLVKGQKAAVRFHKSGTGTGDLQEIILLK